MIHETEGGREGGGGGQQCEADFVVFCSLPVLSFKLTLWFNLDAQSLFVSLLFLHTCFSLSSSLVSSCGLHPFLISVCPPPPISLSLPPSLSLPLLSVHPPLWAALWQQSVTGLGCRRTLKASPRPRPISSSSSSSSAAPLYPCRPLPQGPPQSIFTQVIRRAETHRRTLFPQASQTLILSIRVQISFVKEIVDTISITFNRMKI